MTKSKNKKRLRISAKSPYSLLFSPFEYFMSYIKVPQAENNSMIPVINTNGSKFFISYSSLYFDLFLYFRNVFCSVPVFNAYIIYSPQKRKRLQGKNIFFNFFSHFFHTFVKVRQRL